MTKEIYSEAKERRKLYDEALKAVREAQNHLTKAHKNFLELSKVSAPIARDARANTSRLVTILDLTKKITEKEKR